MAAFQTLIQLRVEWNAYYESRNSQKLAEAMRFVMKEFETGRGRTRTTRQSWMELPACTVQAQAASYADCPPLAKKSALADFLAVKVRQEEQQHRQELHARLVQLEAGTIAADTVQFMVTALDTFVW